MATISAVIGGLAWLLLAGLSAARVVACGPIELAILLAALVIVPLGIRVAATAAGTRRPPWTLIALLQPPAAACVVAAFLRDPGAAAACAAGAWLLFTAFAAVAAGWVGWRALAAEWRRDIGGLLVLSAFLFPPVGAAWLVASRAGLAPMGFAEPIVLLTAVHFHYAGFAAVLFCGLALRHAARPARDARTNRDREGAKANAREPAGFLSTSSREGIPALERAPSRSRFGTAGPSPAGRSALVSAPSRSRFVMLVAAMAVVAGTPVLAAGFVISVWLKLAATILLTGGLASVCLMLLARLGQMRSAAGLWLLSTAALSAVSGAVLALLYVGGEVAGTTLIDIPAMAATHGPLNALGFALCGLLGWLAEESVPEPSSTA